MPQSRASNWRGNRIIDALPPPERDRLAAHLTRTQIPFGTIISNPGRALTTVYFPINGVVCIVTPFVEHRAAVEVASIGNEGIVGVPAGSAMSTTRAIQQIPGHALTMPLDVFHAEVRKPGPLADLVERYQQILFNQLAQAAGCNRLHSNEERLARWLCLSHDRINRDDFPITQEFLAQMLGSRRSTVTTIAGSLQAMGMIQYKMGHLTILDRAGLQDIACECYAIIKQGMDWVVE